MQREIMKYLPGGSVWEAYVSGASISSEDENIVTELTKNLGNEGIMKLQNSINTLIEAEKEYFVIENKDENMPLLSVQEYGNAAVFASMDVYKILKPAMNKIKEIKKEVYVSENAFCFS